MDRDGIAGLVRPEPVRKGEISVARLGLHTAVPPFGAGLSAVARNTLERLLVIDRKRFWVWLWRVVCHSSGDEWMLASWRAFDDVGES